MLQITKQVLHLPLSVAMPESGDGGPAKQFSSLIACSPYEGESFLFEFAQYASLTSPIKVLYWSLKNVLALLCSGSCYSPS